MLASPSRFRPARADWSQAALVALALFLLYASTAPRTVALEDDGLFILSSYFLGIEHPPGYPLFTLIGHLFSKLPLGSVAYRVHLASALFGALTGGAAWLCARSLVPGRLPAYLAAFALGFSPVFWSQAIIAEVYTLNTFFFLSLLFLGLHACAPDHEATSHVRLRRILPLMAFLFGLSLSNHWPLMLLVAPAFLILLWPTRQELLGRFGLLSWLAILGLLPYVWMIRRSWMALPINFDGPLESLPEIFFFISRAGYAAVDHPISANWLDRIKFFEFLGSELFTQFAVIGTLLAVAGYVVQWRILGRRASAALTVAFLMPSAVLLLLLGFDYGAATKHIFHVYPLPAYAVAALWMALGASWAAERFALRQMQAGAAAAIVLGLIFALGARTNMFEDHGWGARYAQTLLRTLPHNALVFTQGEADLAPMAYFQMIENWRPDITLYHHKGLVLGNRLFHPLRTPEKTAEDVVKKFIEQETDPVVFTLDVYAGHGRRDRWLYSVVDKSSSDPNEVTVDIPQEAMEFFEHSVVKANLRNAWIAQLQGELRRRYAVLLASSMPRHGTVDERTRRDLELLGRDFYGALGLAEGLMLNKQGFSAGQAADYLERARDKAPSDAAKPDLSRFFYLRGALRADVRETRLAIGDFETALAIWPSPRNSAFQPLEELYRETGDVKAAEATQVRLKFLQAREQ